MRRITNLGGRIGMCCAKYGIHALMYSARSEYAKSDTMSMFGV